jgi:hypothetical protein
MIMKKHTTQNKKPLLLIVLMIAGSTLFSQNDLIFYHFKQIPQSVTSNPSFMQGYNYHFGTPGLSSVYFDYGNSGFKYSDLVVQSNLSDSLRLDLDGFYDAMKKKNNLSINTKN